MFCHLHVHDEYSILDGLGHAESYVKRAKELGQDYLALTNHANIDGLLRFQSEAKKAGIKPILGCEFYLVKDLADRSDKKRFHITVLIKDEKGFQNLCKMLTIANLKGFYRKPRIDFDSVLKNSEGLVFLSGCTSSPLIEKEGKSFILELSKRNPGNVYLEVMPHLMDEQILINQKCIDLVAETGLELVATNDCHYIDKGDAVLQEVLLAIQTKKKWNDNDRWRFSIDTLFLMSEIEMKEAFREQGLLTKSQYLTAIRNTTEIAEKCCGFEIKKKKIWLPEIKGAKEGEEEGFFERICFEGYERIFGTKKWDEVYYNRFLEEFDLIKRKKFVRYFLLVWELLGWCRLTGIAIGPGRGSVGGSLIAFLMGITNVDPIKYDLLFSRFIDENRTDLPDIDMDFEGVKRPLIRGHLEELYGKNHIASVSTFMKMKGRGVIRDVARVFDVPYKDVDEFAKKIIDEDNDNNSVENASKNTQEGQKFAREYPQVLDYAIRLEGQVRGTSQHAAALIVSAEDLTEGTRGNICTRSEQEVINWGKDDAEYMGLMKLDILGLSTLSVLGEAKRLIRINHNQDISLEKMPFDNPQIFEPLSKGETVGVFQFNTWATTKLVKQIGVESFGMMSDVIALVRPGPLDSGMTEDFIKRKHGAKWKKKHRLYERITKDTFGIIVYQEQVMQVINLVAGLPYTVADKIRKIVAKKRDARLFAEYEQMFIDGCEKEGTLSPEEAKEFWEALQNHARYSFNKAHSVAYAMIAYYCAWLKRYFPSEFLCANLTYGAGSQKEELVKEARRLGLKVILPKVGFSDARIWTVKDGNIYVPFIEIKGVGESTADSFANYKLNRSEGFFDLGIDIAPEKKIDKILASIGALGGKPETDISKYFSFDISMLDNNIPQPKNEIMILQRRWRDPQLVYCRDCGLRQEAKAPVLPSFGIYNVFIIGEAPGSEENEEGKGFVGRAGKLLWDTLYKFGLTRRQFHVSNICKCFPGSIKTPRQEHITACSHWLDKEIESTVTKLCLALGNTPLKYFKNEDGGITKLAGTVEWVESKKLFVCWGLHPAFILRKPENKKFFEDNIKVFADKIQSMGGFK